MSDPLIESYNRATEHTKYRFRKAAIVNISVGKRNFTGLGETGNSTGTGFIVNSGAGYVVTNKHVAPEYAERITLSFSEGQTVRAFHVYSDPHHDFVILKYDVLKVDQHVNGLKLGDFFSSEIGDEITTMGNNENEKYTFKSGHIISMGRYPNRYHSLFMQTSLDLSGGSSGSPIFNKMGEVVAIHTSGKEASSFELCINYVKEKLEELRDERLKRGDIGLRLQIFNNFDVADYLNVNLEELDEAGYYTSGSFAVVHSVRPDSPASDVLKPGDVILAVNGKHIEGEPYQFDKLIDDSVGSYAIVEIYRDGQIQVEKIEPYNLLLEDNSHFLKWAGGTFTNLSIEMKDLYNIEKDKGIFLCRADDGTPFDKIGVNSRYQEDRKGALVYEVCGQEVNSLNDLKRVIRSIRGKDKISVHYQDYLQNIPSVLKLLDIDEECWSGKETLFDLEQCKWRNIQVGEYE